MPKLAANLTMMFNEVPFLARFAAAKKAGFEAVEFLSPYDHPKESVAKAAKDAAVQVVLHNTAMGNWAGGERGIAALPGREAETATAIDQGLAYAQALGCPRLHVMCGHDREGANRDTLIANLKAAAAKAAPLGIKLLLEPLNTRDMPGIWMNDIDLALGIIEAVGPDKVGLQFDVYHRQVQRGDVATKFTAVLAHVAHVQIADNPGRNEPGTGEINYAFLFRHIDASGYRGWVGCEYKPAGETTAGLGWRAKLSV